MLVNTTDKAPALGYAILKNLAYADGLRVSTRKADGLSHSHPGASRCKSSRSAQGSRSGRPRRQTCRRTGR